MDQNLSDYENVFDSLEMVRSFESTLVRHFVKSKKLPLPSTFSMKKQFRVKFPPEIGNDEISPSRLTHTIPMKLSFQKIRRKNLFISNRCDD
jgi:hypothetical protein